MPYRFETLVKDLNSYPIWGRQTRTPQSTPKTITEKNFAIQCAIRSFLFSNKHEYNIELGKDTVNARSLIDKNKVDFRDKTQGPTCTRQ